MAESEINTAHRNTLANASAGAFNGGDFHVRTGARAGANNTATGTLLVDIALPNPAYSTAAAGAAEATGVWSGIVLATGAPGYGRFISDDTLQVKEFDAGDADNPGTPAEALLISGLEAGDLVEGGTLTIDSWTTTMPAGDEVSES